MAWTCGKVHFGSAAFFSFSPAPVEMSANKVLSFKSCHHITSPVRYRVYTLHSEYLADVYVDSKACTGSAPTDSGAGFVQCSGNITWEPRVSTGCRISSSWRIWQLPWNVAHITSSLSKQTKGKLKKNWVLNLYSISQAVLQRCGCHSNLSLSRCRMLQCMRSSVPLWTGGFITEKERAPVSSSSHRRLSQLGWRHVCECRRTNSQQAATVLYSYGLSLIIYLSSEWKPAALKKKKPRLPF